MPVGDHVRHILETVDVASLFVFLFPVAIVPPPVKLIQLKRLIQPSNADTAKEADTAVQN